MQEIERKFLVQDCGYRESAHNALEIQQAYLNNDPKKSVRVRLNNTEKTGSLTIKGESSSDGRERFEWETRVKFTEAEQLLNLCPAKNIIRKTRFLVVHAGQLWGVDEFFGANYGLVVAEIELEGKHQNFEKPGWCGREITGNPDYYNLQLSKKPFKYWSDDLVN